MGRGITVKCRRGPAGGRLRRAAGPSLLAGFGALLKFAPVAEQLFCCSTSWGTSVSLLSCHDPSTERRPLVALAGAGQAGPERQERCTGTRELWACVCVHVGWFLLVGGCFGRLTRSFLLLFCTHDRHALRFPLPPPCPIPTPAATTGGAPSGRAGGRSTAKSVRALPFPSPPVHHGP